MHTTPSPQKKSIRAKEIRKRIKEKNQQSSKGRNGGKEKKRNEKKREMAS